MCIFETGMAKVKTKVTNTEPRFLEGYLPYLMAHASYLISAQFQRYLAAQGVRPSTWRLLGTLAGTGGLTIGGLANEMILQQPTVTRIVDRLENEGLVERRAGASDRRQVIVDLTPRGRLLFAALERKARRHQDEVLATYSPEQIDLLFGVLRAVLRRNGASEWGKLRLIDEPSGRRRDGEKNSTSR
jgi:DNA-binding MarR family transcriptional regulator